MMFRKFLSGAVLIVALFFVAGCGQYDNNQGENAVTYASDQGYHFNPYPSQETPRTFPTGSNNDAYSCNDLQYFINTATSYEACNTWLLQLMDQCNIQYVMNPCAKYQKTTYNPYPSDTFHGSTTDSCRTDADCSGGLQCFPGTWAYLPDGSTRYFGSSCGIIN